MSKELKELSYIKENHLQLAKEKYRKLEPKMLEDVLARKATHYDIIEQAIKELEFIKKCFYVAKSSGAVLLTDYGFDHEEELKEVLL